MAPPQMPNRGLNGGFGQPGLGGNGLKADRQGVSPASCCLAQEIKIDDEGRGPAIMADQIGHEHIHDVIFQIEMPHR